MAEKCCYYLLNKMVLLSVKQACAAVNKSSSSVAILAPDTVKVYRGAGRRDSACSTGVQRGWKERQCMQYRCTEGLEGETVQAVQVYRGAGRRDSACSTGVQRGWKERQCRQYRCRKGLEGQSVQAKV